MQVSNTSYVNYNQVNQTLKNEKSSSNSFSTDLENQKSTENTQSSGKYINYMKQFNHFSKLSSEDREVFLKILEDDKITLAEMDSLSYEQAEKFEYIAFPQGSLTKEQLSNVPIVSMPNQIPDMLFATRTTNDKTFNKALYETAREISNDNFRSTVFGEVKVNLSQAHFGFEILSSFNAGAEVKNLWQDDVDSMNIDFDKFLNDVINLHEKAISNSKTHPAVIQQHQESLDGYNIIKKHYYNIKNEVSSYA
ncbi:hypothetical protein [Arcobacter roscoffensis]|uniref:Uncharacterized protein n=1 Tax=Arcobacter roscoffensis TaxID=2961520 RepID=A0ABY5E6A0_9BACT|nr:hypothetical protein [Arcobacter roscoffensis]UTJ06281.1 hypothetical protein NJU99_13650 [Arcobacter roscoffensis]